MLDNIEMDMFVIFDCFYFNLELRICDNCGIIMELLVLKVQ